MRIELECSCGARFEFEGQDFNELIGSDGKAINDWPRENAEAFTMRHEKCGPIVEAGSAP